MTGRIDDVDLDFAVTNRSVFGHDGDAALAFEVEAVHHALDDSLVVAEGSALLEHGIDQSCLAVVDVRDDRDVADVVSGCKSYHGFPARVRPAFGIACN